MEKSGYPHFMLKEIHEQPQTILDTMRGRYSHETGEADLPDIGLTPKEFAAVERIWIVACGTSWHAGLVGKYLLEEMVRTPVQVDIGSEFRYRDPLVGKNDLFITISQSGETADTLAAAREAKEKGARVVSVVNVVGSTLARESDGVLYTHCGPEIGVASTKAFTAQLTALYLLALHLARVRKVLTVADGKAWLDRLDGERDNFRTALAWAMETATERALALVAALLLSVLNALIGASRGLWQNSVDGVLPKVFGRTSILSIIDMKSRQSWRSGLSL